MDCLGPAATIALLLPMTYVIGSPVTAVIMMAGIYYGAMYGGSTTSILLNLPGEAASFVCNHCSKSFKKSCFHNLYIWRRSAWAAMWIGSQEPPNGGE